jgi:multiple sugar transport system permease protein
MLVSSMRRPSDVFDISLLPSPASWDNYTAVFDPARGFARALGNSLVVAGSTTFLAVLVGILAAYALARMRFRFTRLVLTAVMATSMFPVVALIVPLLQLFTDVGWINTYQAMVIPSMSFALPLAVWNLTVYFREIPVELEEAATVDGCTQAQAFRRVILPLAAPGVATTAIITFVIAWNEFIIALTMTNKASMRTAPVAISTFVGASQFETPFGTQMAAGVVITIPLIVIVLLFQRRIIAGLSAGGVK